MSASEWPSRPWSKGTSTPASISGRPGDQPVQVVAGADAACAGASEPRPRAPPRRSSAVVIFMLPVSPSTRWTATRRARPAWLRRSRRRRSRPVSSARASTSRRNACGVCARKMSRAARSPDRPRSVASARTPACFTVSRTGSAAIAAPWRPPRRWSDRSGAADTNGRAASWTAMMSASARDARRTRSRPNPAAAAAAHARSDTGPAQLETGRPSAARCAAGSATTTSSTPDGGPSARCCVRATIRPPMSQELLWQAGAEPHAPATRGDDRRDHGRGRGHASHRACSLAAADAGDALGGRVEHARSSGRHRSPGRRPRPARRAWPSVTIVRAESDVGLPNGPSIVGQRQPPATWTVSLRMPAYSSPSRPRRRVTGPRMRARS